MRALKEAIGLIAFGVILGAVFLLARGPLHLFAPPLVYHCPPGHILVTHWEKGTAAAGQPGTLAYHGYTEWASCSDSLTIDGG